MTFELGDSIPDFELTATDNSTYSPSTFRDSKILVVMFICNHCPYVRAYEKRMIELQSYFQDKGVSFVAVNSNDEVSYPEDSFENMIKRSEAIGYNFPYLRDDDQSVAKAFGASFTPEIYVFDQERKLQYTGRIDDNWQEPEKVTEENLKDAILALLEGKEIDRTNTRAIGCTVKWK